MNFSFEINFNPTRVQRKTYTVVSRAKQEKLNTVLEQMNERLLEVDEINAPESCFLRLEDVVNVTLHDKTLLVLEPQFYKKITVLNKNTPIITDYCNRYLTKGANLLGAFGNRCHPESTPYDLATTGTGDDRWYIVNNAMCNHVINFYESITPHALEP